MKNLNSITDIVNSIDSDVIVDSNSTVNDQSLELKMEEFNLLDIDQLRKLVFKLPNKESSAEDMDSLFFKEFFEVIGSTILHLINTSLEFGIVPSKIKTSVIIPVRKILNTKNLELFRI